MRQRLIEIICPDVERLLGYTFGDKNVLLTALTHESFKNSHGLSGCYEKLEVLGDAILDYIANSNLLQFTMYDKYNIQERAQQEYIMPEDFKPFDAHQAKSHMTKNEFLAKLLVLFGFHEYVLFDQPVVPIFSSKAIELEVDWRKEREKQQQMMDSEIDKYIMYSYQKNFTLN